MEHLNNNIGLIMTLKEASYSWAQIAERLGVSPSTIYSWRNRQPEFRQVGTSGLVDHGAGTNMENRTPQPHQEPDSSHPHFEWYIDGEYNLSEYRLCVHGGVDGFSRLVVMLECHDNNRAVTVLEQFGRAVDLHSFPLFVRTDRGGENILVHQSMQVVRGEHSSRRGSSTRNQQRFWKFVRTHVLYPFVCVFEELEEYDVDFENDEHVFCVHFLFLPIINLALQHFAAYWNSHKMRALSNHSPSQLLIFYRGMLPEPVDVTEEDLQLLEDIQAAHNADNYDRPVVKPVDVHITPGQMDVMSRMMPPLEFKDECCDVESFLFPKFVATHAALQYVRVLDI
jgi:hypothetical protein